MAKITIEKSEEIESLLAFILDEADDEISEQIDIRRVNAPLQGLGGEPLTTAAVIMLTVKLAPQVTRLIERWVEKRGQIKQMVLVGEGFDKNSEAGQALAKLGEKYADVSISYKLFDPKSASKVPEVTKSVSRTGTMKLT